MYSVAGMICINLIKQLHTLVVSEEEEVGGGRWSVGVGEDCQHQHSVSCVFNMSVSSFQCWRLEREREKYIYTCDDSAVSDTAALKIS